MSREKPTAYFVMGVCGSGKSTVARGIAKALGIEMLDADDFHSQSNVDKMRSGIPLTDEDRAGWLERLNGELRGRLGRGESVTLACSALKRRYRETLQEGLGAYEWIYLKGDRDLLLERVSHRKDHYMPPELVDSQLEDLEEPESAMEVDIRLPVEAILKQVSKALGAR